MLEKGRAEHRTLAQSATGRNADTVAASDRYLGANSREEESKQETDRTQQEIDRTRLWRWTSAQAQEVPSELGTGRSRCVLGLPTRTEEESTAPAKRSQARN
jgi:hypothetical protein